MENFLRFINEQTFIYGIDLHTRIKCDSEKGWSILIYGNENNIRNMDDRKVKNHKVIIADIKNYIDLEETFAKARMKLKEYLILNYDGEYETSIF